MHAFDYLCVRSVAEAADALARDEEAKVLAGGMSLLPVLRHRLASPSTLIDLNRIPGLREITVAGERLRIGAMATHHSVASAPEVRRLIPALADLAGGIGDPLVRNRGTIGGSLANNDPAACYPSALLALDGIVHTQHRAIGSDDFIRGTFQTALEPGEIIIAVEFPRPSHAAYVKFANFASRFSIVGVFLARRAGTTRIGVTGAGPCAFRPTALEAALDANFAPEAVAGLSHPAAALITDIHASAEFRAHLVTELTMRAVARALAPPAAAAEG